MTWIALLAFHAVAGAQEIPEEDAEVTEASREDLYDPTFGPVLVIEGIEVTGNDSTATRLILRALDIAPGDAVRAGDPRLLRARFEVLAMGYFRDVELSLRKGSERGKVILEVAVVERGTVILESLYFGTSVVTPWWAGLDLSDKSFLGSGIALGGGFVVAGKGDVPGSETQWAVEARLADASILGSPFGAHGAVFHLDATEPFRVRGDLDAGAAGNFEALPYRRTGGRGGLSWAVTPLTHLDFDVRGEAVRADVPDAPVREHPDGTTEPIDLDLLPGRSRVVAVSLSFDRDRRADPILPYNGDHIAVFAELGATWLGSDYSFGRILGRYQKWWRVAGISHVISLHLHAGVVLGEAPRFDRLYVSDFNRMLTPRALGLVVSAAPSFDILGTDSEGRVYGDVGGSAMVEYSYRLFRSQRKVYGGDLFIGAGVWALAETGELSVRDESLYRSLPIDMVLDAGLRLDTEIGIFELTFANALGRVPL